MCTLLASHRPRVPASVLRIVMRRFGISESHVLAIMDEDFVNVWVAVLAQNDPITLLCAPSQTRVATMERESASSSSGGEHPALFDPVDLHFFDLTAEDADEAKLRKSYHKKSLSTHPDKGGCKEAFQNLGFLYEN